MRKNASPMIVNAATAVVAATDVTHKAISLLLSDLDKPSEIEVDGETIKGSNAGFMVTQRGNNSDQKIGIIISAELSGIVYPSKFVGADGQLTHASKAAVHVVHLSLFFQDRDLNEVSKELEGLSVEELFNKGCLDVTDEFNPSLGFLTINENNNLRFANGVAGTIVEFSIYKGNRDGGQNRAVKGAAYFSFVPQSGYPTRPIERQDQRTQQIPDRAKMGNITDFLELVLTAGVNPEISKFSPEQQAVLKTLTTPVEEGGYLPTSSNARDNNSTTAIADRPVGSTVDHIAELSKQLEDEAAVAGVAIE